MGLFNKKSSDEYAKASKKLNQENSVSHSINRVIFEMLKNDDSYACELVEKLKGGHPLVINFAELNLDVANKFLAFFTGACYAVGGNTVKIDDSIYLFALKEDFLDGTLEEELISK